MIKIYLLSLYFYTVFLFLYRAGISIASLFNPKAKSWIEGRKFTFSTLEVKIKPGSDKVIWMHCASLGEFEQGRPLLESIKNEYPAYKIVLSFFSPSGYEIRKNYPLADAVIYLPLDGPREAQRFINSIKPGLVLWIKYEYWYFYLGELKKQNIPTLLVSGIFRESQPFFKWYGSLWKTILYSFRHLFVQNEKSAKLLSGLNIQSNVTVSGDTRFDRVIQIATQPAEANEFLRDFLGDDRVIVAGSTWEDDETEWTHFVKNHPEHKFIFAPHEIHEEHIADLKKAFPGAVTYSQLKAAALAGAGNVLIIDNIGMLSSLYRYADIAYVGGGFNDSGIHNILEAAVYGKPVIFGPEYERFEEANGLIDCGAAFSIDNALELEAILTSLFTDEALLQKASAAAKEYVYENKGATQTILNYIQENRLLTN